MEDAGWRIAGSLRAAFALLLSILDLRSSILDLRLSILGSKQVFQQGMAGLPQPEAAFIIEVGGGHAIVPTEPSLGAEDVEPAHDFNGMTQRPGYLADFAAQPAQDAANLPFLFPLEDCPFGAQVGDAGRLDEHSLAGAAGSMDDPLDFMTMVDRDRKNVMISADGGIGVAQNLAKFVIA